MNSKGLSAVAAIIALLCAPIVSAYAMTRTQSGPVDVTGPAVTVSAHNDAISAGLRSAYYRALAKDSSSASRIGANGCTVLNKAHFRVCFGNGGERFTAKSESAVGLRLVAYGRRGNLVNVKPVHPSIHGARVSYAYGDGVKEWWRPIPLGYEQGFTVSKRPTGTGNLVFNLVASRSAKKVGSGVSWGGLHYGGLVVTDGAGKVVPAQLTNHGAQISISINDQNALYPLTVDPVVWINQNVTASDGVASDFFGTVAISGKTAIIGANNANNAVGAAYVFSNVNGSWQQAQELTPPNSTSGSPSLFGESVAISGNTIAVGAPAAASFAGAVYVYTKTNGVWNQVQELTQNIYSQGALGWSVAISEDETTIVSGAPFSNNDAGTAFVFTKSGGSWSQGAELSASGLASGDNFGWSVSISDPQVLVGASEIFNSGVGAAYVFTDSNGNWTQTAMLTPGNGVAGDEFGYSVGISGSNALVGSPYFGATEQGTAYAYSNSSGTWSNIQQIADPAANAGDNFGFSLSVSNNMALIGAPDYSAYSGAGAAYLYGLSNGSWDQLQTLNGAFGSDGVAGLSVDLNGDEAIVGAPDATINGEIERGAASLYGQSDLELAVSAPETVEPGTNYVGQAIVTNSSTSATPASIAVTVAVPASASLIGASATQGSCSQELGIVTCDFGAIPGNAGTATANLTLKVIGQSGVIENTANVENATPALTASAPTTIAGNTPPVASNGTLTTNENTAANGTLQASDADGNPLTFSIVSQPSHGTVTVTNASTGTYTYTPNTNYTGSDSFTFKANDGQSDSNTATISITVKSTNTPPVASNGTLTTNENTAANGTLQASDADGNPLTFSIVSQPSHGAVTVTDSSTGAYTYTPNTNYTGSDSFTFRANDGQADSNTATVSISVEASVTPPPPSHGGGGGASSPLVIMLLALMGLIGRRLRCQSLDRRACRD